MLFVRLIIFFTLSNLSFGVAAERSLQICIESSDPNETASISNKLDELSISFTVDKSLVCVSNEYEEELHRITLSFESSSVRVNESIDIEVSPNGIPLDVITIENQIIRNEFIARLKDKNIWYKTSTDNKVHFEFKDRASSQNMYLDAVDKVFPPGSSISYFTELAAKRLSAQLDDNKIIHSVRKLKDHTYVVWNAPDDAKVRTILKEIESEQDRRRTEIMTTAKTKKELLEKITALYTEFGYESAMEVSSEQ